MNCTHSFAFPKRSHICSNLKKEIRKVYRQIEQIFEKVGTNLLLLLQWQLRFSFISICSGNYYINRQSRLQTVSILSSDTQTRSMKQKLTLNLHGKHFKIQLVMPC